MRTDRRFFLVLACFVLSGMAGLIYQTAWTQQFALAFGTSELAVATVLAAYMAGLMAGAAVAGRWLHRVRRPVLVYAVLELGIGVSALAVPAALKLASRLQVLLIGGFDVPPDAGSLASALFYLLAAFVILLVPTGLMGATLPLLVRHAVHRDAEIGPRVGLLYSSNTAGAAFGTMLAAFILLPRVGLGWTVAVAVAINVAVFGLAALLAKGAPATISEEASSEEKSSEEIASEETSSEETSTGRWILPVIMVSGFVSFGWEVLWTRLLSHLVGGSIYAFGTMLATFLAGLGLGSAAASRWATSRRRAEVGFVAAQLGVALCSYAAFVIVDRLPSWLEVGVVKKGELLFAAPVAAATLLPGALFIGATFPFAVRILAGSATQAGVASARVYAWNTFGGIAGAVGTGFFLLPALRIAGTAAAAVTLSLVLALVAALLVRPRRRVLAALSLAGLVGLALMPPQTPWQVLRTAPLSGKPWQGDVAFYAVGRSSTVMLFENRGQWRLTTNGLPESIIHPPGSRQGRISIARWLGILPSLSRPEAQSYLVVGLGAGITLDAVPPTVAEIDLVELEPEVIRANRSVADGRQIDPLADPRVRLHVNDARSALTLSDRQFDAIVSQPSHPWTAGASHLFTREFFRLVRDRLLPEGVFVQWIGQQFVDESLTRSLLATLLGVFPYVEVYMPPPGGGLLFLSGLEPLNVEEAAARSLAANPEAWSEVGVLTPEDALVSRFADTEGVRLLAADAPLTTDARNLLQTRSPRILSSPLGRGSEKLFARSDPLIREPPSTHAVYYIRRLIQRGAVSRAGRVAAAIRDPLERQTALALVDLASGRRPRAQRNLRQVAGLQTGGSEALHAAMLLERQAVIRRMVPAALSAAIQADPTAAMVAEGWRLLALRNLADLQELEPRLAEVPPRSALFQAAINLRISWRQQTGDPAMAAEALDILEPLLARGPRRPAASLLLRARLATSAGQATVASASLRELAELLGRRPDPDLVRGALAVVESLQRAGTLDPALRQELERLTGES